MTHKNKLNEVSLASIDDKELKSIKDLEKQFGDKYYIIAFDKDNPPNFQ
ncbi:hypothetical protein R9X47_17770 [Wukongibacter baidiensis]